MNKHTEACMLFMNKHQKSYSTTLLKTPSIPVTLYLKIEGPSKSRAALSGTGSQTSRIPKWLREAQGSVTLAQEANSIPG